MNWNPTSLHTPRVLIFTATYNEGENIAPLLDEIVKNVPSADILVIDDNSPDGTADLIKRRSNSHIKLLSRPEKLGVGSAHKCAMHYAIRERYDYLVTMDADFSHDPGLLPTLLAGAAPGRFVTGSRYCAGGRCDYTGYRKLISRLGNIAARWLLRLPLNECTTFYRVFSVKSLELLPFYKIRSNGYAFGVQIVFYLSRVGIELVEMPIHFTDRQKGKSKIPPFQIFYSAIDLLLLTLESFQRKNDQPEKIPDDRCLHCGQQLLSLKYDRSGRSLTNAAFSRAGLRYPSLGIRRFPAVYTCLACGLDQVPRGKIALSSKEMHLKVKDCTHIDSIEVEQRPFSNLFDKIRALVSR